jgi:heptosyltransferase-2
MLRGVNWLGDAIMTIPAIRLMRVTFPQSSITIVTPSALAPLYVKNQLADKIIPCERRDIGSWVSAVGKLCKNNVDLAILFPSSFQSALMAKFCGASERIGYGKEGRDFLLTKVVPRSADILKIHRIQYYLKLLNNVISLPNVNEEIAPYIELNDDDRELGLSILRQHGVGDGRVLVGMHAGSTYGLAKRWLPDRFLTVANSLINKYGVYVILFGSGKDEIELARWFVSQDHNRNLISLAGKTSVIELASLISLCRVFITNDTGPMHVAQAVGTPIVAVFGSTDVRTTAPYGNRHIIVKKDVECSPCLKRKCPIDHRCMYGVSVADVLKAVEKWMK